MCQIMNSLLGFLLYFFFVGVVYTSQTQNDELFYLSSSTFLLPGESPVDFPAPLVALTPANPGSSRFFISDISSQHGSRIHKLDLSSSSSSADNTHGKLTPIQTLQGKDLQLGMIRSMGFDADRSLLFVADTATKTLMKIKLDSPHQMVAEVMETIVSFNETGKPLSIAYHRCSNTLYWTNWNRDHPCIERSNVDGSDRSVIVRTGLSQPSAVTFDPWNKSYIFWIDEDRSQGTFKIERSLLDGSEREVICSASGSSNIFDLTVDEHFIYWSDWKNMVIWKTAKKQQHQQQPSCQMEPVKRLNSRPMGISAAQIPPANEDCLDLDVEHEFKPAPAAVSLQMTKQQNEEDANPVGKEDPCLNYCLNGAKCTVTSSDITVCLCDPGFSGQRCQLDQCQNYCLNGGLCSRVVASAEDEQFPSLPGLPSCQCGPGFSGHRCQRQSDLEQRQLPFILAIVFLSVFLVFSCCVILCISIRNRKSQEDSGKIRSPQIVRKRSTSRSFSGNRESSKSAAGKLNSAAFREACGGDRQTSENASCGGSGGSGVVIDLEDCCKMTLCDTPCVEATFRKPTNRKKRTTTLLSGSSTNSSCGADRELLLDNEIPPDGRVGEICS